AEPGARAVARAMDRVRQTETMRVEIVDPRLGIIMKTDPLVGRIEHMGMMGQRDMREPHPARHITKNHCKGADIARQRDRVEEPLYLRTHVSHALFRPEAASQDAVPPAAVLSCRFRRVRGFPYP